MNTALFTSTRSAVASALSAAIAIVALLHPGFSIDAGAQAAIGSAAALVVGLIESMHLHTHHRPTVIVGAPASPAVVAVTGVEHTAS